MAADVLILLLEFVPSHILPLVVRIAVAIRTWELGCWPGLLCVAEMNLMVRKEHRRSWPNWEARPDADNGITFTFVLTPTALTRLLRSLTMEGLFLYLLCAVLYSVILPAGSQDDVQHKIIYAILLTSRFPLLLSNTDNTLVMKACIRRQVIQLSGNF